jgi:hypothetical protein
MDMFSFGSMLLCVFDHDGLNFELGRLNINLCNQAISLETYRTELQQIQRKLRTKGNDPWCLIADCIDFDPTKRPTSEQAEGRLMAVEATLKSSKTGTFEIPAPPAQTT